MPDFALVICSNITEEPVPKQNFLNFLSSVKSFFQKLSIPNGIECELEKIQLDECLNAYIIKIPYALSRLSSLNRFQKDSINRFISAFQEENNIDNCIVSERISEACTLEKCKKDYFNEKQLYRCLFMNILDEIFTKKGIKIGELDIAIIHGKSIDELTFFIKLLSESAKYLTVITESKTDIEEAIGNIYSESGLAVRITEDMRSGLKDTDLVINFGDVKDLSLKASPKAIVINYGNMDISKMQGDNILINGLEVKLPKEFSVKFNGQVMDYFNSLTLAAIILSHKRNYDKYMDCDFTKLDIIRDLSNQFIKDGYRITGVHGRRSTIKIKDI